MIAAGMGGRGATGVLVYTDLRVGFTAISSFLILGLAQTVVSHRGQPPTPGPRLVQNRGRGAGGQRARRCGGDSEVNRAVIRISGCRGRSLSRRRQPLAFG